MKAINEKVTAAVNDKTPADAHVVVTTDNIRMVTYYLGDKYVWEVQERGIFFFWKWYRRQRWSMKDNQAVIIP